MPIKKGKSNIGTNIKELTTSGKSRDQAIAIALEVAKKNKRAK